MYALDSRDTDLEKLIDATAELENPVEAELEEPALEREFATVLVADVWFSFGTRWGREGWNNHEEIHSRPMVEIWWDELAVGKVEAIFELDGIDLDEPGTCISFL
jgi:plasmid stabilization system protein ParE